MDTIMLRAENIQILPDKLKIEIPTSILRKILIKEKIVSKKSAIRDAYGSWKRHKKIDPLEYQRKIRAEWD